MLIAGNMPPKLGGQPHDDRGDYFEPKSPLESIKSGDPQGLECYQQAMRKSAEADFAACAMEKIKMELDTGLWQALVVLQRALLNEHHDFSLPHERDSYSPALRRLSRKYLWPVMAKKARRGLATTLRLISYINQHHYKRLSGYSSASKRYYVKGSVDGLPIEAFPDSGAEKCFISPEMASNLGLSPMTNTQRATRLANKKQVQSPGMVQVPWIFAGEDEQHLLKCWILPGCIHDLVLGHDFIKMTQTFTKFKQRVKNKLSSLRAPFLRLLGSGRQRVVGFLNGEMTFAMPDTGSDLMLVSGPHARRNGLLVDNGSEHRLEVGLADGSTCLTTGVVRDVSWAVGDKTVRCEFHVLEDLCVDVVLSKDYLFDLEIFSTYPEWFIDIDSEENVFHFFNIRLLGRYGSELNALEEQYLVDLNSPNAFDAMSIRRELARRDLIRDGIMALPEGQREEASGNERKRQSDWEKYREDHRRKWGTQTHAHEPDQVTQRSQKNHWGSRFAITRPFRQPFLKSRKRPSPEAYTSG